MPSSDSISIVTCSMVLTSTTPFVNRLHDFLGPSYRIRDCTHGRRNSFAAVRNPPFCTPIVGFRRWATIDDVLHVPVSMFAIVEIDIRHFIKPAFVPVAVDMASEGHEQYLIDPVPHEVFMRPRFRICFREGPRRGFNELLEIGRKFAQVLLDWFGHRIQVDIAPRAVRRLEPIPKPPVAPARIAGGATNDNVFYLQTILDVERLVEIQMLDGREILSDST